ncbi:MAG: DUF3299 domain-containing protein [Candidatus Promineifilaceae bacterium]|nr:DUF3299 domain-containing protein [Candidatus Promineifilaceae bacterium]
MNFSSLKKQNQFYFLFLLTALIAVSCSGPEQPEASLDQIPSSAPTPAQPVEYGASLSEWEEAVQAEQADSSRDTTAVQPQDLTAPPTITIMPTETALPLPTTETTEESAPTTGETLASTQFMIDDVVYQEIMWDALVPADFTAEAIMAKYAEQLAQISDGSPEGFELYSQMQAEFNNAPVNETMDGTLVRLPGFIAPLEYTDDLITEFLLVPYFGACIHVPPPPANQTVLVKLSAGQGIKFEESWEPYWVMGKLTAEGASTELAEAGYFIENAQFELYKGSS